MRLFSKTSDANANSFAIDCPDEKEQLGSNDGSRLNFLYVLAVS